MFGMIDWVTDLAKSGTGRQDRDPRHGTYPFPPMNRFDKLKDVQPREVPWPKYARGARLSSRLRHVNRALEVCSTRKECM